jgi:hypothetical protein
VKFEDLPPGETHKHRITFEQGDECDTVGSAYRERVVWLATDGKTEQIRDIDLTFSEINSESDYAILASNP